jgi:hypothetical protein
MFIPFIKLPLPVILHKSTAARAAPHKHRYAPGHLFRRIIDIYGLAQIVTGITIFILEEIGEQLVKLGFIQVDSATLCERLGFPARLI